MRFTIYTKIENHSVDLLLLKQGHIIDDINPEVVISIGGDGTMLSAIHHYMHLLNDVMFVGINFGRLGFYTDFTQDDIVDLIDVMNSKNFIIQEYNLLETKIHTNEEMKIKYALNEISLMNAKHTQIIDVFIDNDHFESFRGTGFVISTPTGSTAFNKSLGGSVIEPRLETMQLTEVASINNRLYKTISSPLVFYKDTIIRLDADYKDMVVAIDGKELEINNIQRIETQISNKKVKFIVKETNSFWHRVKKSFLN